MDELFAPLSAREASLKSPLSLALLGDTVWDLLVRRELLDTQKHAGALHRAAIGRVNAHAQRLAMDALEPLLLPEEADIVRRGQNAHARHAAPKNQDPLDYSRATALEALVGYLYLSGQRQRLMALYRALTQPKEDVPDA